MFLDDAEIKYEYNVIEREQWQSVKAKYIEEGLPFDCVPMIELDGKRYSGTQPILRFLSKKLGKFEGVGRGIGNRNIIGPNADSILCN